MSGPALLAVAHGSAHPAAAATTAALVKQVERLAPVLDVQLAFVQHAEPTLADALDAAGPDVVIVPLLLSTGYHLTTDIGGAVAAMGAAPAARRAGPRAAGPRGADPRAAGPLMTGSRAAGPRVARPRPEGALMARSRAAGPRKTDLGGADLGGAGPRVAGPLGPDQLLVTALAGRLAQAGVPTGTPLVLAAAGSSDPRAATEVAAQAELLARELAVPVVAAFAAAGRPTVPEAVAELRARTAGPVAVATYLLAPGQFHDALGASGADWVTDPLGDHPAVAALIIDRYRTLRTPARAA